MSQAYSDPKRADDPHALPDLEIFYAEVEELTDSANEDGETLPAGWYWWPCFPGCLPDGDARGPFESYEQALTDAREECNSDE